MTLKIDEKGCRYLVAEKADRETRLYYVHPRFFKLGQDDIDSSAQGTIYRWLTSDDRDVPQDADYAQVLIDNKTVRVSIFLYWACRSAASNMLETWLHEESPNETPNE